MAEFLSVSANLSEVDLQLVEVACMLQRGKPDKPPGLEQICGHSVEACCRRLPGVLSQLDSRPTWVHSSKMKKRIEQTDKNAKTSHSVLRPLQPVLGRTSDYIILEVHNHLSTVKKSFTEALTEFNKKLSTE